MELTDQIVKNHRIAYALSKLPPTESSSKSGQLTPSRVVYSTVLNTTTHKAEATEPLRLFEFAWNQRIQAHNTTICLLGCRRRAEDY